MSAKKVARKEGEELLEWKAVPKDWHTCHFCDMRFSSLATLTMHDQIIHSFSLEEESKEQLQAKSQKKLNYKERKTEKLQKKIENLKTTAACEKFMCSTCSKIFFPMEAFFDHMQFCVNENPSHKRKSAAREPDALSEIKRNVKKKKSELTGRQDAAKHQ